MYTDLRPTPLQHYLFPSGGEGIYLVVNEKGDFRDDNFQKAMGLLADMSGEDPASAFSGKGRKGKSKKGGTKGTLVNYSLQSILLTIFDKEYPTYIRL